MNIVINALSARRGGGQTYLRNLLEHGEARDGLKIFMLAPDSLDLPHERDIERIRVRWPTGNPVLRAVWERFFLPRLLKETNADVLFCPGGVLNTIPPEGCKTVTMFRNMIPFDPVARASYPPGPERVRNWLLERAMMKAMTRADLVIFLSNFARDIIEERAAGRIGTDMTIPHGLGRQFMVPQGEGRPRPSWLPEREYLLYVSYLAAYKHHLEVVRGFHLLKQRRGTAEALVLAGNSRSPYGNRVRGEIERLGLQDDVLVTGDVPHQELPGAYYHAKINIFASGCENCPNILLEALGAGRPMAVSNRPPMPEFGGNAVVYFDPRSPEDFADKLVSFIDDPAHMAALSARARERSAMYDWGETALRTWNAIRNLGGRKDAKQSGNNLSRQPITA